jgi:hypothetical protein
MDGIKVWNSASGNTWLKAEFTASNTAMDTSLSRTGITGTTPGHGRNRSRYISAAPRVQRLPPPGPESAAG